MKVLIVFALISLVAAVYAEKDCAKLEESGEAGLRKLFLAEEGGLVPKTVKEFEDRCSDGKRVYRDMLEYKECLKPFPQQIFSATTKSVSKLLKNHCDPNRKEHVFELLTCANKDNKLNEAKTCAMGSLDVIQKLSQSTETKSQLIPKVCCLAHVTNQCANKKLEGIKCNVKNKDGTSEEVVVSKHFQEIMDALSKDALELACADYKDHKTCNQKIPEAMAEMKQMVDAGNAKSSSKAVIRPLLKIAEKIAD